MNRVVITGMGVVAAAGNTPEAVWERVLSGVPAIAPIKSFDTEGYKCNMAAEVDEFDLESCGVTLKEMDRMDRFCHFALYSAITAFKMSGAKIEDFDPYRCGVIFGSGIGGLITCEAEHKKLLERGPGRVSSLYIPMMISNEACGHIAMRTGFKGVSYSPVTACATGTHAIGEAYRNIKHGYSDIIIAGGSEATISPLAVAGFANMKALTHGDDRDNSSLPFDKRRSGFVIGEGGAALVLESLESAKKRGAVIYGEIVGYGATGDAYHITSPDPEAEGSAAAMRLAIEEAGISPSEVDYINAHGTGTPLNDKYETIAIKKALGEDNARKVSISSTKGVTGHLLGAAGALEAIITAMALERDIVPPTANLRESDPDCDLDYTPLEAKQAPLTYAINNSLGFGGQNAAVLLKKFAE